MKIVSLMRVSVLMNLLPIFYGISRIWVEFKDMFNYLEVDCFLEYNKKCCDTMKGPVAQSG